MIETKLMDNAYLFAKLFNKKGQTRHPSLNLLSQYHLFSAYNFQIWLFFFFSDKIMSQFKKTEIIIHWYNYFICSNSLNWPIFKKLIAQSYFVTLEIHGWVAWPEYGLERNTSCFLYLVLAVQGSETSQLKSFPCASYISHPK